jgi:hypothetical protein
MARLDFTSPLFLGNLFQMHAEHPLRHPEIIRLSRDNIGDALGDADGEGDGDGYLACCSSCSRFSRASRHHLSRTCPSLVA